jgi:hypothetical protein
MDIDIDFADRNSVLEIIQHIPASLDGSKRHNTGVYCHEIPVNPLTGLASIDYRTAETRGYFKLDFLNVNIYRDVKDNEHLERLMNTEPLWDLLEQDEFVNLLFHVNGHGNLLRQTKPTTVEQLAAVLAMIRPAKRYLVGRDWDSIMQEVWIKPANDEYYFKKAHALSYAMAVIVHMNLICESISHEYS